MAVTNIFDLDLNQQFRYDYYAFFVNQGDYQSRTIQSNLYITYIKDGTRTDYNLTDETITISYEYTNGNGEIQNSEEFGCTKATSIGNNVITFLIPNIVVENPGKVRAQVKIYGGASILINTTSFLFYVGESISVGTIEDLQIPLLYVSPIIDSGAPTTSTQGVVGQLYINDNNDSIYYCSDITGGVYTWNILFDGNYIATSDFNANTILAATLDNTPVALTITEQTVVGRTTGGNIAALAIDSDLSSVSANDDTLPSAKATKSALDGKVDKSTFDAHTILYAATDNTPVALTVTEQTLVGRVTGGSISAIAIDSTLSSEPASHNTLPSAKIVYQKLATKANQTLTDSGDYYTVKTPEGALQEVGAQLAEITPNHNHEFSGRDLSTIFADAAALHTAVAADDFSKIRVGDYWPVTLNGSFYDYSSYTAPSGTEYFSDTGLTTSAGTLSAAKEITYVNETYCTFKISDVSYYVATSACLTYFEKTLSNATLKYEVCPQTYIRYSDTSVPNHLLMVPRDCLPLYLKMRKTNTDWTDTEATNPWLGSALHKTLNDPDHGIIALLAATDIGAYIYAGPNGKGMRFLGETKAAGASNATSWGWLDRGKLFLPLECEVWGVTVWQERTYGAGAAVQWPIFTGSLKHISKGVGDGASRSYWWCASSCAGSAANFAYVYNTGYPYNRGASNAYGVPPCFLFT